MTRMPQTVQHNRTAEHQKTQPEPALRDSLSNRSNADDKAMLDQASVFGLAVDGKDQEKAAPAATGALSGLVAARARYAEEEAQSGGKAIIPIEADADFTTTAGGARSGLPEDAPVLQLDTTTGIRPWEHIGDDNLEELRDTIGRSGPRYEAGDVITFAFPQQLSDLPGSLDDDTTILGKYGQPSQPGFDPFIAFDSDRQSWTLEALDLWSDVADISFQQVAPGEEADLYLFAREHDTGAASANGSVIRMNVNSGRWDSMDPGGYGFDTMVHEIGHKLGLAHPGDYDASDDEPISYDTHRGYIEDTDMYSIMSYWNGEETGFDYGGLEGAINTPRTHDLWVIHDYYGANWDTRDTNTTYGFNAQGVDGFFDFDWLADQNVIRAGEPGYGERGPVLTIWDGGGNDDWLDLSGDDNDVVLDLSPGAFSSTHGMTKNISLAYVPGGAPAGHNALIENARGGDGDDALYGNSAANSLHGGDGDDFMIGYGGIDYFAGGLGNDTVSFSYSDADWTITLGGGFVGSASNAFGSENLLSIENIVAGSGDDDITGSDVANMLEGGAGDDTIDARDGDDKVYGGTGADDIRGGDGDDILSGFYSYGLNSIGDDDIIRGGNGNDEITGHWGDDTLYGQSGDDTVYGGAGDDWISGNNGLDELYGGGGVDTADYRFSNSDWTFIMGFGTISNGSATEVAEGFERARMGGGDDIVIGTADDNDIRGGAGNDELVGYFGADILIGEAGNDTLNGGAGNDVLSGGTGADTGSYSGVSAGVAVDLALSGSQNTIGAGFDNLISIERLEGSAHADILSGNHQTNWLNGGSGGDLLFGRDGADWLRGDGGDDILEGGNGNDIVNGGDGEDAASYFFADAGVWVNLDKSGSQDTRGAGLDVLYDIEHVIGSFHADWLTGNDDGNRLTAGAGDDILNGGAGSDTLDAGIGNDVLIGGTGVDIIDGGDGIDWAYYNVAGPDGATVDLTKGWQYTGAGGTDLIIDVENILGSSKGDELLGDEAANELRGGAGNDVLHGRGGDDTLEGGTGNDIIYVGEAGPPQGPGGLKLEPVPADPGPAKPSDTLVLSGFGETAPEFKSYTALQTSSPAGATGNETLAIADGAKAGSSSAIGGIKIDPGSGDDTIIFKSGWGNDEVFGYNADYDTLDFTKVSGLSSHFQFNAQETADGSLVSFGANSVLLHDVFLVDLDVDLFLI
ncbi:MAG: M10 family metallopeptidase C-terminal domain-containing protein [Pseudomonadota bacterium]